MDQHLIVPSPHRNNNGGGLMLLAKKYKSVGPGQDPYRMTGRRGISLWSHGSKTQTHNTTGTCMCLSSPAVKDRGIGGFEFDQSHSVYCPSERGGSQNSGTK